MKKYILRDSVPTQDSHDGWENSSYPIGNSHMGATIFGIPQRERLQLNEKSLWTGGPSPKRPNYNGGNISESYQYLEKIRNALEKNNKKEAKALAEKLVGLKDGYGAFQSFGNIYLNFNHCDVKNYVRELDISHALAEVSYVYDDVLFRREYLASYPDRVIAAKIETDRKGCLNFSIEAASGQPGAVLSSENSEIEFYGEVPDNGLKYYCCIHVESNGKIKAENGKLFIEKGDWAVLYCSMGTDYKNEYPKYRGKDPKSDVVKRIYHAVKLGYDEVKRRHIADYQNLFNRMELSLCEKIANVDTKQLLAGYGNGGWHDRYFEELLYQYGRYLLISSSREDDELPANLQGVWNDSNEPAWGSDYHLNVNLQMCYWHAFTGNLAECAKPMVEYMDSLRPAGRVTAQMYHNIRSTPENPENGWVCHTQNTPFGWTCPGWHFYWGWSPTASSWMMQNCYDYFAFTEDIDYLKNKIYPMMKENAKFWLQNLIYSKNQDRYVSSPTFSPEHGPISTGNTYEQTLIYQLMDDTIKAAKLLKIDEDFTDQLRNVRDNLKPMAVGKWGQIKEWYDEDSWYRFKFLRKLSYLKNGAELSHRHCSHLLGLYPGTIINSETPELMDAAKISLIDRGFGTTGFNDSGWGKANKICLWARLKEPKKCITIMKDMIKKNISDNLWDLHPPFQMDGNCGFSAAVAEMLIYSNDDYIELLPALPDIWKNGEVKGICARGGFVLDFKWDDGKITSLTVRHKDGKPAKILRSDNLSNTLSFDNCNEKFVFVNTEKLNVH